MHVNSNLPMLCIGDMNDILYASDKSSSNINRRRVDAFHAAIKNCGLFDVGFSGPAYTWTNRRFTSKPLFQRLDRCLVNHDWCGVYPITNVYNMLLSTKKMSTTCLLCIVLVIMPLFCFQLRVKWPNLATPSNFQNYAKIPGTNMLHLPLCKELISLVQS
jgi:hypothetical protein